MGQYYILVNVLKSQEITPFGMKAVEIVWNGSFLPQLALLLLDLGNQEECSLEKDCQKYLATHEEEYQEGALQLLPKHQQKNVEVAKLQQLYHIGAWAGDRLIIIGDYSDKAPFPPNGEWKSGNLFSYISEHSNPTPDILRIFSDDNREWLAKLRKVCEGKVHFVVNLDKKEYLDPRAYSQKTNALEFGCCKSVLTGLVIKLIFSTGSGGGDLPTGPNDSDDEGEGPVNIVSRGTWAGDRITICTAEQLDDFGAFKEVSNDKEVKSLFKRD